MTQQCIKTILLEDHPMAMDGYLSRFARDSNIEIIGQFRFGDELVAALQTTIADVLLLDINVPTNPENPNPFPIWHVIQNALERNPEMAVIIISMYDRPAMIDAAIEAGVSGYVLKEDYAAYAELPSIIRVIVAGGIYFSPIARQRWLHRRQSNSPQILSSRQLEALSLCATYSDENLSEIARRMNIAASTLRNMMSRLYLRLDVNSRSSAVSRARLLGLLPPEVPG
jgi:DNA-binding NarL/FixJ family response regulator